jgi:hypothetical protein
MIEAHIYEVIPTVGLPKPQADGFKEISVPMANFRKTPWGWDWGRHTFSEIFGADLRSLAVLRVVLALTVLFDLASRAANLAVHYSDGGILPRRVQVDMLNPWSFSANFVNGTAEIQGMLFCVAAFAALAMLVGYRTRIMVVIVWLLVMSIQWRNYLVGSSADDLLRLLLFWSIFLPLGSYWSFDRLRGVAPAPASNRVLSVATAGLFLQIALMYWFTALIKSGPEWRVDGTAIYYALSSRHIGTSLGAYLLQFPDLLKLLTFGTLAVEIVAPILLFSPFFTVRARMTGIAVIVSLHAGIWMTLSIGMFPWIGATCMVCFLPSWFWDRFVPDVRLALRTQFSMMRPVWQGVAGIRQTLWTTPWLRLVAPGGIGWFSVAELPTRTFVSPASVHAVQPGIGREVAVSPLVGFRSWRRASLATNLFASACLIFVLVWNLSTVSAVTVPSLAQPFGRFFGLTQYWAMFAPSPIRSTRWIVIPGTLQDGRQVDLLPSVIHDNPRLFAEVDWREPGDVRATFNHEERWRKYLELLSDDSYSGVRLPFGQYVCRNWNGTNGGTSSQLMTFEIVNLWGLSMEENQRGPVQEQVLWSHIC